MKKSLAILFLVCVVLFGSLANATFEIDANSSFIEENYHGGYFDGGFLNMNFSEQSGISKFTSILAGEITLFDLLTKKEAMQLEHKLSKLERSLGGIKDMLSLPDCLFVIDIRKEELAIAEARKLGIPVVAVVDSNCDPSNVDYIIPGNDDAIRAVRLFCSKMADAMIEGVEMWRLENAEEDESREVDAESGAADEERAEERAQSPDD